MNDCSRVLLIRILSRLQERKDEKEVVTGLPFLEFMFSIEVIWLMLDVFRKAIATSLFFHSEALMHVLGDHQMCCTVW